MMSVDPVAAARYFVSLGCTAFPVWGSKDGRCNCGDPHDGSGKHGADNVGKHPATNSGFKDGTADLAAIARFLSNPGTPNYGLVAPPGVLVVDVDGVDGIAKWDALQHQHGPLPVTLTTLTANGRHYFYRWPESAGVLPTGKVFGFVTRRHDDGYIIGPGSVHPKGVVYDTLRQANGHPYAIAELPALWANAILAEHAPRTEPGVITIDAGGYQLPEHGYSGARYDEIVRYTASRYVRGIPEDEIWEGVRYILAPRFSQPLTESELRSRFERAWANTPKRLGPPRVVEQTESGEVRLTAPVDEAHGILPPVESGQFPAPPDRLAFGGLVGEVVAELARGTDASEAGMLGALLAFMGALYPATGHFGRQQSTAIFVGLVGPSTEGRKGTAMERAEMAMAQALGASTIANLMFDGVNSGEGLVSTLESRQARFRNEPVTGIMYEEEFATLLAAQSRDNSTLDPRMRAAWDGKVLSNRKQSTQQSIEPPYWVSALVAITPKELRAKSPTGAFTSGSFNRWLWLPVIRRDVDVLDTPPDIPYELRTRLSDAYHSAQQERPFLRHTPDAQRLLFDYSTHLAHSVVGMERDLSARLVPIALRVALIHAMVEGQRQVTLDHVRRGIALAEYARSGIGFIFGMTVGDPLATLLLRKLMEEGVVTKHQITQDITRDALKRQNAIDALTDAGLAEVVRVTTAGRPRQEVRLVTSRGLFTPFVQLSASQPSHEAPLSETPRTPESAETRITHETHKSVGKGTRPCPSCHEHHPVGTRCEP